MKRIRDYGIIVGELPTGERNAISDVAGVRVGHVTLDDGPVKTGVTAVLAHPGNIFKDKVLAGVSVMNGFGKTTGLIQVEELGTIETPIVLTNTFSVGVAYDALVKYMLETNDDIGLTTGTVNPVVAECNDGYLNDIRGGHVRPEHIRQAIAAAAADFAEGAVGAGTGMSCYELKGGIGSASRIIALEEEKYAVGALVLANFGLKRDLTVNGFALGAEIVRGEAAEEEKGSIIVLLATDIPLSEKQLSRLARRASTGLARTGSYFGNGSGDVYIAFSTANRVAHYQPRPVTALGRLDDSRISLAFRAAGEAVEEAILNAMIAAGPTTGRDGNRRASLREYMHLYPAGRG